MYDMPVSGITPELMVGGARRVKCGSIPGGGGGGMLTVPHQAPGPESPQSVILCSAIIMIIK